MPFDGIPNERQQVLLDKLEAVSELLSSERKWCQRHLRLRDGSRCLLGALIDVKARWLLHRLLISAAREVTGTRYSRIESFNDEVTTNFALVQAVLDRVRVNIVAGTYPRSVAQDVAYFLHRRFPQRFATTALCRL